MSDKSKTDKLKVIEKIRKLIQLQSSPNEHEAARAAEFAQELLATYNIDMSDVKVEESKSSVEKDSLVTKSQPWERILRQAVAHMYFCEYYYSTYRKSAPQRKKGFIRHDLHFYVGEPQNVLVAKMMSEHLSKTVKRLAQKGCTAYPKVERSRYRKSFVNACSWRLRNRIYDRVRELKSQGTKTSEGRNLPALQSMYDAAQALNKAFIEQQVGEVRETRSRTKVSHYGGAKEGREAGDQISLDQQVESDTRQQVGKD